MYELEQISDELKALVGDITPATLLPHSLVGKYRSIAVSAKAIIEDELGFASPFSMALLKATSVSMGMFSGPIFADLIELRDNIRNASAAIDRKHAKPKLVVDRYYVDPSRILQLKSLKNTHFDFRKLIEMCRELNVAYTNQCYFSCGILLRAILDHVPPLFGASNFNQVVDNYAGKGKSFKAQMDRLNGSLRGKADLHLHTPIALHVYMPTAVQIDFASDLDLLLSELININNKS